MKTLNDFTDYVAAADKLAEVTARHAGAVVARDALLTELNNASARPASLEDAAQRLLDGGVDLPAPGSLREQYGSAQRQVSLLAEVVRLAKQRLEDARAIASQTICAEARPEFSRLVLVELQAAHALLVAQQARRDYWQGLNDAGVSMATLPGVAPTLKGDLHDPTALFWQRVDDAVELGYVAAGEFKQPERAPDRDSPLDRAGLRMLAAGPEGVGLVETVGDGRTTRPVTGHWNATPKTASDWNDAA